MKLPADHPQRTELKDEVHARPPEPLVAPSRLSYLALLCDAAQRDVGWLAVSDCVAATMSSRRPRAARISPPPWGRSASSGSGIPNSFATRSLSKARPVTLSSDRR